MQKYVYGRKEIFPIKWEKAEKIYMTMELPRDCFFVLFQISLRKGPKECIMGAGERGY